MSNSTKKKEQSSSNREVEQITSTVGRVSSVVMKEGKQPEYMYDDGSILDFEEGFRMMVGEEKQPSKLPAISGLGESRLGNSEHSKHCDCLVCKRKIRDGIRND